MPPARGRHAAAELEEVIKAEEFRRLCELRIELG
jgi:hypothetical protein